MGVDALGVHSKSCSRAALVCALLGLSGTARADPETRELAAESYFTAGVELMKHGQFAQALERFRASERLSSASGTLLDIAYCERQLGHTASAWLAYRQALGSADERGKSGHSAIARQGLSELEPDLPFLLLRLPVSHFAWSLELDGERIVADGVAPIPIDPGDHKLTGTAGDKTFQIPFSIAARERKEVELPEPPATAPTTPPIAAPAQVAHAPLRSRAPVPPPARAAAGRSTTRTLAFVSGGLGAATLLTGVALFTHARLTFDSVKCPDGPDGECDSASASRQRSARKEAIVSYGLAGVGAALLGVGVALWLAPPTRDKSARSGLELAIGPTECDLVYRRSF